MNPIDRMDMYKQTLSDTEKKIYSQIITEPSYVTRSGIVGLAEWCGVSQPSITRFCKKIGYQKYTDFKHDMYRFILAGSPENNLSDNNSFLQDYINVLTQVDGILTSTYLGKLAKNFWNAQNIYFTGIGESGNPGRLLETKLRRFGLKCSFILPTELNDLVYYGNENDLLMIFSVRGPVKGNVLGAFFKQSEKFAGKLYLVTMNSNMQNKNSIDQTILLPVPSKEGLNRQVSPTLIFHYFSDKLITSIASEQ